MNWFRTIPKWVLAVMLFAVSGSFIFWGIPSVFSFAGIQPVVKVGDAKVYAQEFQQQYSRFLREESDRAQRPITAEEGRAKGLDLVARERLVTKLLLERKAHDLGLVFSREQVVEWLRTVIGDGHGGIDAGRLSEVLQNNQMSEGALIAELQGDRVQRQLYGMLLANVEMPKGMLDVLQAYRLERRVAEYVLIDPARAGEIKDPGDAELRKYYDAHKPEFAIPEYRSFVVASVSGKEIAAGIQVTDEEIQKVYDARKKMYVTPEKRELEQIQFPTEEKARAGAAALASGKSFEDVAKQAGFKPEDIKLGEVSADDPSVPAVAFTQPLNKVSDPVKSAFGWVIVRATSSTPGSTKTLDEVRQTIRDEIALERAKDQVIKLSTKYDEERGSGAPIEEVAKKLSLRVTKVGPIDKDGKNDGGQTVDTLPIGGDFLDRVFNAEVGTDMGLQESNDGVYYEFRVDTVKPAAQKPFESVRNDVFTRWHAEQERARLQKIADGLVKRGSSGTSMADLARELGVAPLKSEPLPRTLPKPGVAGAPPSSAIFSETALTGLFDTKVGGFFAAPVTDGRSIIVARVDATQQQAEPANAPQIALFARVFNQSFVNDLAEQFTSALRHDICSERTIWERVFGTTMHDCVDDVAFAKVHGSE